MIELLRSELMMIFCHHDQSTEASVLVTRVVTPHICLSSPVNPLAWIMRLSTEEQRFIMALQYYSRSQYSIRVVFSILSTQPPQHDPPPQSLKFFWELMMLF